MTKLEWAGLTGIALLLFNYKKLVGSVIPISQLLQNQNIQAMLATIRHSESGGDYSVLYGGGHFYDYSAHPDIKVPFFNRESGKEDYSTAAGAYQINHPTYLLWSVTPAFLIWNSAYQGEAFDHPAQDALAVAGLQLIGAVPDILAGNFSAMMKTVSRTWASLPYSTAQQNPESLAAAQNLFVSNGGVIA